MIKFAAGVATTVVALGSLSAQAADTLYWTEVGPSEQRFQPGPGYIKSGTLPGGATSAIVSGSANVRSPNGLEFLNGRIYWTDPGLGTINSVKPDGSDIKVYGDGTLNPYDIDLVGSTLYWTDQNANQIFTIDTLASPAVSTLLFGGLNKPVAIDVVGTQIYWSEVSSSGRIRRSDLDGSNAITVLSGAQSYDFEVTDQYIYLATTFGDVKRANLDGTGLVTLASGLGLANGIDVTDDAIYVSQFQFPSQIVRMDLDGGNLTQVYAAPTDGTVVRGVAVLGPVPEPSTMVLSALGLLGVAAVARRRR